MFSMVIVILIFRITNIFKPKVLPYKLRSDLASATSITYK